MRLIVVYKNPNEMKMRSNVKPLDWQEANARAVYPADPVGHMDVRKTVQRASYQILTLS
jgi:hypothetical protein